MSLNQSEKTLKKISRYTGISRYLRYHNLHSKMQWKVHYTLQTIFNSSLSQKPEIKLKLEVPTRETFL